MKTSEILTIAKALLPATTNKGLVDGMDLIICSGGSLTAYNDKIAISYIAPEELENEEFSVLAEDFISALKSIKSEEVEIFMEDERVKIKSKDVEAELSNHESNTVLDLLGALDYDEAEWKELPDDFLSGLSLCSFSASNNVNDRQLLFCVAITENSIIATDKHRIGVYENEDWEMESALIPYYSVQNIKQFNPDAYFIGNGWMHFINENDAILSCRMFYNEESIELFEQWKQIIYSEEFEEDVTIPQETIEVLDNMLQFSDEVNNIDKNVVLKFKNNKLSCKAEKETGTLTKKLKIKKNSLNCDLNFRAMFLRDILKYVNNMNVSKTAIRLQTENFTHVLSQQYKKE